MACKFGTPVSERSCIISQCVTCCLDCVHDYIFLFGGFALSTSHLFAVWVSEKPASPGLPETALRAWHSLASLLCSQPNTF